MYVCMYVCNTVASQSGRDIKGLVRFYYASLAVHMN